MDLSADRSEEFEAARGHLRAVATRMLGSVADADDAVSETWLRLRRADTADVVDLRRWLTTVLSRICLDLLRARRARPETPAGGHPAEATRPSGDSPEADAVLGDSVGRALVLVLETLRPAERVAFVLHDVFAVPFADIADVLDRSPEATKKLVGRARRRVQLGREPATADLDRHRRLVEAFLAALRCGDTAAVVSLLGPDVVRRVDPVLLPDGVPAAVRGATAVAREARTMSKPAWAARPALVDRAVGAVVGEPGAVTLAIVFRFDAGAIAEFEVIVEPARLAALEIDPL